MTAADRYHSYSSVLVVLFISMKVSIESIYLSIYIYIYIYTYIYVILVLKHQAISTHNAT